MKATVAILMSDKLDFKIRNTITDKEGYFIRIKWFIHQNCMIFLIVRVPTNGSSTAMKQILAFISEIPTPHSQLAEDTENLPNFALFAFLENYTPTPAEHTFSFSSTHELCTKVSHTLDQKIRSNKLPKMENLQNIIWQSWI